MAVKKGGIKTGGEGNKGNVTPFSKVSSFDSDSKDKIKKKGMLTGGQMKIAAKAPPKDKITGADFAVLRAEKPMKAAMGKSVRGYGAARTSGTGLMDEQMAPGKVMNAKRGDFVKRRMKLAGVPSNPGMGEAKDYKKYLKGLKEATKSKSAQRAGDIAMKAAKSTRLGKIVLGIAGAGIAAKEYLKRKKEKKKELGGDAKGSVSPYFKKKMGGGMMKKYSVGGGADMGIKKDEDKITKRVKAYALAQKNKDHDRLTERDIAQAKKIVSKKMGGGMMNKPMGYKSGTMVMARGCKLGRKKATKLT